MLLEWPALSFYASITRSGWPTYCSAAPFITSLLPCHQEVLFFKREFSHDVKSPILVFQNNGTAANVGISNQSCGSWTFEHEKKICKSLNCRCCCRCWYSVTGLGMSVTCSMPRESCTGKNNRFPFLDILGYLKNTHKNPKFGRVRHVPTRELGWEFPGWDLSHFAKFGILGVYF